jgi:hypothetical protein
MLASQIPARIPLPFANGGTKNTIPTASQIGITPGAASLTDGFPLLTFTPLAAGGVPPAGADFNGILNAITAVQQWQSAGGSFTFNTAFSTSIGGYPKGSVLISTSGDTNWLSTSDNNATDPDSGAAGNWVALDAYGIGTVTGLTNANITLTPAQYGKNIITLAGALTGNVQIILPFNQPLCTVINNTSGAFTVTCKTASGTGSSVMQGSFQVIYGDGTNIAPVGYATQVGLQQNGYCIATAGGTSDAITGTYTPTISLLTNGMTLYFRAAYANATTTPTFKADGMAIKTVVKGNNLPLAVGDIAGAGHWIELQYDLTLDKWVLLNPAMGVSITPSLPEVPVRQTVLSGPVYSSGLPSFLSATSASLSIASQNIAAGSPFVVAAANGFGGVGAVDRVGISTVNLTWAGLTANTTNYLYVDVAANGVMTPGSTVIAPIYQQGGIPAVVANQATFNTQQMQMFVGNGGTAPQAYRVFVGEVVTGAAIVTSTVAYAYMGQNIIQSATLASTTLYSYNHQIGVGIVPRCEYALKCVTANNGWAVGDEVNRWIDGKTGISDTSLVVGIDAKTVLGIVADNSNIAMSSKASAAIVGTSVTNWQFIFRINRGW